VRRLEAQRAAERAALAEREERVHPHPQASLEAREVEELLRLGLGSLPPREREAFVLRDLEGLETADVARTLEITESSVRSLLTLARRRLRECLGPMLEVGGSPGGTRG
jgi:RNA polymerase sigma-70 factor (ECF subfamily)